MTQEGNGDVGNFGFKSSKIPYQEVMATTGMKCAYYKRRSLDKKIETRRRSR